MDKSSSVAAALNAGKYPSQKQISQIIERLLASPFLTNHPSTGNSDLSAQGQQLQKGVCDLLTSYKTLGQNKNSDNIVQESLWHLSEADLSNTSASSMDIDTNQAKSDARALARSIGTLVSVVWENLSEEGRSVFHDFASFMRLALADAADYVGESAQSAAETLRDVDKDVQEGQRNELGVKRKAEEEPEDADARARFERAMDSTKETGSKVIGAGQVAIATGEDLANRTSSRLQDAFNKICDRAQSDQDYHDSIVTIFDLARKWIHRSLDSAGDVNQDTSLDAFIDDPTPEKHLITAIRGFRQFVERLANDRSLDGLFAALRVCGVDIQQDPALRQWCDEFIAHLRKSLDERGYVRSDEAQRKHQQLREEWKAFSDKDSDKGRKWKEDVGKLKSEVTEFQRSLDHDQDLRAVRRARAKLGEDIENGLLVASTTGLQAFMDRAPWFWQDIFNVYLPKVVAAITDIPIPRTEYKDDEIELVLEDLDISSFAILPGHAYIRNITDIDIKAPVAGQSDVAVGTLTRIYLQGLQIQLKEVSFYYREKKASMTPGELNGILELTLPPKGVDVDVVVRSIPNSVRSSQNSFLDIHRVDVKVSEDIDLTIKQSNHQFLVSVFRPIVLSRVQAALETVLQAQIRGALEFVDSFIWDVASRAEVFQDTGLPRGASLIAGLWSELGHLRKVGDSGLFSGWKATGTGIIKDDKNAQFAMGAEPQVLSGEKRGPKGTFADSLEDRMDVEGNVEHAKGIAQQATETVKEKLQQAKSWTGTVSVKAEEERAKPGWQSSAFDWSQ